MDPLSEVEEKIKSLTKSEHSFRSNHLKKYFSTNYKVYGLRTPEQRKLFKQGFSCSNKSFNDQLIFWDSVWRNASVVEIFSQCLFWLETIKNKEEIYNAWAISKKWVVRVDNWLHSDQLSAFYSRALEEKQKQVFPVFSQWNKSSNPWKRRQSLVGIFFYFRFRQKILPSKKIFPLIESAVHDSDYYVQRGLGWCLRECFQAYPDYTYTYIYDRAHLFSSIAFTTSCEKMSSSEKRQLKKIRKLKK